MGVAADWGVIEPAVATALAGETIAFLNRGFTPPPKTQDPAAPASWFALYDADEGYDVELADFAGGEVRRNEVGIGCWVEPGCGSKRLRAMVDQARAALAAADAPGIVFLAPRVGPADFAEPLDAGDAWYGCVVWWPFTAQG